MKKLNILITLFLSINLFADELVWVDTQVEAIKPSRDGVKYSTISILADPFIFLNAKKKVESKVVYPRKKRYKTSSTSTSATNRKIAYSYTKGLILETVINNSVQINGNWYKLNDNVKGHKLTKIDRTSVILTRYGKKTILSTKSKNSTLKFKK